MLNSINNGYLSVSEMGSCKTSMSISKHFMYFIKITFFLFIFAAHIAQANTENSPLKIIWLGTTTIYITDGETGLLFDPFITRPLKSKVLTFQKLKSNKDLVKKWNKRISLNSDIKAIFVSHTHYDHVLDLEEFAKQSNADVYGSKSVQKIIHAENSKLMKNSLPTIGYNKIHKPKTVKNKHDYQTITVGNFNITVLPARHAPHIPKLNITFLKGKIKSHFKAPASVLKYKMDDNFSFFIKHKSGNILFHPSSEIVAFPDFNQKADVVIQGIKGETTSQDLLTNIIQPFGAKVVIPVHYDYFFWPLSKGIAYLKGVKVAEFCRTMKQANIFVPKLYFGTEYVYKRVVE